MDAVVLDHVDKAYTTYGTDRADAYKILEDLSLIHISEPTRPY